MTNSLAALAAAMLPDRWAEFQVRHLGLQHKDRTAGDRRMPVLREEEVQR
jgi:hypothetical protein